MRHARSDLETRARRLMLNDSTELLLLLPQRPGFHRSSSQSLATCSGKVLLLLLLLLPLMVLESDSCAKLRPRRTRAQVLLRSG